MKYCSRHNMWVMLAVSLLSIGTIEEESLLALGYQWKQLVLPGFDKIMGV